MNRAQITPGPGRLTNGDIEKLERWGIRVIAATPETVTLRGRGEFAVDVTYADIRQHGLLPAYCHAVGPLADEPAIAREGSSRRATDRLVAVGFVLGFALASLIWSVAR